MIRPAGPGDVAAVVGLVQDLAEYERAAHQVELTADGLHQDLFGDTPRVFAHVAEVGGEIVGAAIWFWSYSTWRGRHGVYLEDLYVQPAHRGAGHGKALLAALAAEAVRTGCARVEWSVLDWNTPAIDFYASLGAVPMAEWTVYRLSGDALTSLATTSPR
ncbi:MAG TPA: GNAT family N-acetyltransferase [Mycobacteriales bacterium]|nr:GNAT family N-acetyltransferase [Mycobacteriales bacterium]